MGTCSSSPLYDYDLVVVGAGSAGLTAANFAADLGAKVLLIEKRDVLGGDCTWYGCVPSKALIAAGHAAASGVGPRADAFLRGAFGTKNDEGSSRKAKDAQEEASSSSSSKEDAKTADDDDVDAGNKTTAPNGTPTTTAAKKPAISGAAVGAHIADVRARVYAQETPEQLEAKHGVETRFGEAVFDAPHALRVGDDPRPVTFAKCVLCTGSGPAVPATFADVPYDTNETIFDAPPTSGTKLAVVGAGPIGCELAQACARLGADVTVFTGRRGLLSRERADAKQVVERAFREDGVKVVTPTMAATTESSSSKKKTKKSSQPPASAIKAATVVVTALTTKETAEKDDAADDDNGTSSPTPRTQIALELVDGTRATFDRVLVAAGRTPRAPATAVSVLGAQVDAATGGLVVDPTTLRCVGVAGGHVYAAGDCIAGTPQFTHIAGWQGFAAARNALVPGTESAKHTLDMHRVPRVTYTDPEVGSVGLADVATAARVLDVPAARLATRKWTADKSDRALCEREDPAAFVELVLLVTKHGKLARIVGGTAVSSRAGEILSEIALIAEMKLSTLQVGKAVHPYPTHSFVIQHMCSEDAQERFFKHDFIGKYLVGKFTKAAKRNEKRRLRLQQKNANKTAAAAAAPPPSAAAATVEMTDAPGSSASAASEA